MSAQRLSPRTLRRIERMTGLSILRGWAHGGYDYSVVTPEHVHFRVNSKDWTHSVVVGAGQHYYPTCSELFPQ